MSEFAPPRAYQRAPIRWPSLARAALGRAWAGARGTGEMGDLLTTETPGIDCTAIGLRMALQEPAPPLARKRPNPDEIQATHLPK